MIRLQGRGRTIEISALGKSGNKDILRRHEAEEGGRCRFKGEDPRRSHPISGVSIETLPIGMRLMIAADRRLGRGVEIERVQPDAAKQQCHHGQADN